jgi:elongation factor P
MFEGEVLGVELSPKVVLDVIEAEPAVKGDTATNVQIKVKVETGLELYTPAFVKEGDKIEINTADGSYSGRA